MAGFFQQLFKPKWQHADHSVRIQAIQAGLDEETLKNLANNDPVTAVQTAALNQISDTLFLLKFINHQDPTLSNAVREHYLKLITGASAEADQIKAIGQLRDLTILMTIAAEWSQSPLGQAALEHINDEEALVTFAQTASSNKVRLLIAEKVNGIDALKSLEKTFKGKDKTAAKQVKAKIQAIEAEQQLAAEIEQRLSGLLDQIQSLAESAFNPNYVGKLAYLKQAWASEAVSDSQNQVFEQWCTQCENVVNAHEAEQKAFDAQQQKQKDANAIRQGAIETLQSVYDHARAQSNHDLNALSTELRSIQHSWGQAASLAPASAHQKQDYETLIKPLINLEQSLSALESVKVSELPKHPSLQETCKLKDKIQKQLKRVQWPNELAKATAVMQLEQQLDALAANLDSAYKAEKQTLDALDKDISALETAVNEGNIKQANKLQQKVRQLLGQVEKQKSKSQQQAFTRIITQLSELKDWQGFAAEPKFVALCEAMEQLAVNPKAPQEQSTAIHALQDEWKALGSLGDKKRQDQLWLQFKSSADRAFEPCRQHFDEQAKVREFNRQQREAICQSLETLFSEQDWGQADYKAIQRIIDKAYHEYKSFAPVDRDINKSLQERFNQASGAIKNQLKQYYLSNAEQKQHLVDQCQALLESEDLADATEQCKALQQTWKTIENAGRRENGLWTEFRKACDAVFAKRQAAYQAKRSEQGAAISQAEALVAKANSVDVNGDALEVIQQLKEELLALSLPAKVKTALLKKIDSAQDHVKEQIKTARSKAEKAKWENALDAIDQIAQWETSTGEDFPALESASLPKPVIEALSNRESQATKVGADTLSDLCFEIEIAAGLESPKGLEQARMAFQVKKLQSTMGTKPLSRQDTLEQTIVEWCRCSALSDDYPEFSKRFESAALRALGVETESA